MVCEILKRVKWPDPGGKNCDTFETVLQCCKGILLYLCTLYKLSHRPFSNICGLLVVFRVKVMWSRPMRQILHHRVTIWKDEVKCAIPYEDCRRGAHVPLKSVMHGRWEGKRRLTFPATGTKLYCLVWEAYVCEQFAGFSLCVFILCCSTFLIGEHMVGFKFFDNYYYFFVIFRLKNVYKVKFTNLYVGKG